MSWFFGPVRRGGGGQRRFQGGALLKPGHCPSVAGVPTDLGRAPGDFGTRPDSDVDRGDAGVSLGIYVTRCGGQKRVWRGKRPKKQVRS